jgi:hypothetical protein
MGNHNQQSSINLKLSEIKLHLMDSIKFKAEQQLFRVRKSDFTFTKKNGEDFVKLIFFFYDYAPLEYRVSLGLLINNGLIQRIKSQLQFPSLLEKPEFGSFFIHIGDIIESEADKPLNIRRNFAYAISSEKDLLETTSKISSLLEKKVFPLSNELLTIKGIDKYFKQGGRSVLETKGINSILSNLISAKLNGDREILSVSKMIKEIITSTWAATPFREQTLDVINQCQEILVSL